MTKETSFYRLEDEVGRNGAEYFVCARWNVHEFEWDPSDPSTYACEIKKHYECTVPTAEFNVDCWLYTPHVCGSRKLIDMLDSIDARYRAVPFELLCKGSGGRRSEGEYYIVLLLENISIMDTSRSEYDLMVDLETGEPLSAAPFASHPMYEKIKSFVFREDIDPPPLYSCTETGWIMVSEKFISASQEVRLRGPAFIGLEDGVQYDALSWI